MDSYNLEPKGATEVVEGIMAGDQDALGRFDPIHERLAPFHPFFQSLGILLVGCEIEFFSFWIQLNKDLLNL